MSLAFVGHVTARTSYRSILNQHLKSRSRMAPNCVSNEFRYGVIVKLIVFV